VDFVLIEPRILHVMAGDARSDATAGRSKSDASTDTDGVSVVAGDGALRVVLLHSDSTAGGRGQAYLASVNGGTLPGSQSATDNPVVVNRVLYLGLLRADREGAEVGSARDGKSQPVVGLATVRHALPMVSSPSRCDDETHRRVVLTWKRNSSRQTPPRTP
jgi:hypothetical protein